VTVKDVAFAFSARNRILSGVEIIANAVQVTLGPKGRTVALGRDHGTKITKDGVSVAREIELDCQFQRAGAKLVRAVALKVSKQAGDGTTTAIVLSKAIARSGVKAVEAGVNPMDLRRGINRAVEAVVAELAANARRLTTNAEIAQIATISANGDRRIGELIASAVEQVGADGVIKVEDGAKLDTELELVHGIQFNRSYISPRFVTDRVKRLVELEDAVVLLRDGKLASIGALVPLLEKVVAAGKPLLVVADDFEPEVRAALVLNNLRGSLKVVAVKSPAYGEHRRLILDDIALMTGGTVFSDSLAVRLQDFPLDRLGRAGRVTVDHQNTMIAGGAGKRSDIDAMVAVLRRQLDAMSVSEELDYDREMLQQRIATLAGGVAFVRVGGASEVDVRERVDRIRNAVNATRAAAQEGISPGGGVALLRAGRAIRDLRADNDDQNMGVAIVREAVAWPARQIALNAGEDASVVVDTILRVADGAFGYDAQAGEYGDMFARGIIEPVKVVRTALQCAASVAGGILTTEVIVAERPGPPPPDMPGHDHHDDHDINFEW
jgi:chaperonin GroEL